MLTFDSQDHRWFFEATMGKTREFCQYLRDAHHESAWERWEQRAAETQLSWDPPYLFCWEGGQLYLPFIALGLALRTSKAFSSSLLPII